MVPEIEAEPPGRPTRHNLRWYPINQYVAGERGQSPLLYMGSPYLEFLDLGEGACRDGAHLNSVSNNEMLRRALCLVTRKK